mmetsp:Transcript_81536/g.195602  ORF Transcript_81536/g.195602 Transcript_81536/m.195602 type:complete len:250 (+) Transcript_81536:1520-2269(+)
MYSQARPGQGEQQAGAFGHQDLGKPPSEAPGPTAAGGRYAHFGVPQYAEARVCHELQGYRCTVQSSPERDERGLRRGAVPSRLPRGEDVFRAQRDAELQLGPHAPHHRRGLRREPRVRGCAVAALGVPGAPGLRGPEQLSLQPGCCELSESHGPRRSFGSFCALRPAFPEDDDGGVRCHGGGRHGPLRRRRPRREVAEVGLTAGPGLRGSARRLPRLEDHCARANAAHGEGEEGALLPASHDDDHGEEE